MNDTHLIVFAAYAVSVLLQGLYTSYTLMAWSRAASARTAMPTLARGHYLSVLIGEDGRPEHGPCRLAFVSAIAGSVVPVMNTALLLNGLLRTAGVVAVQMALRGCNLAVQPRPRAYVVGRGVAPQERA